MDGNDKIFAITLTYKNNLKYGFEHYKLLASICLKNKYLSKFVTYTVQF